MAGSEVAVSSALPQKESNGTSLQRRFSIARVREQFIKLVLLCCALVSIATTVGIIFVLLDEAVFKVSPHILGFVRKILGLPGLPHAPETAFFQNVSFWEFFTETRWTPQFEPRHFGIMPLLSGTFLIAGIAAVIGLPIGLASAIYLSEYASPRARNILKPTLELLAGIPTVVYGYFALVVVTPYLLRPLFQDLLGIQVDVFNAASAGIVVGIMIIPMVSSLSEDVLRSVPGGLREAGYALGSTKFDVSVRIVVPAALSGIIAAFLLAISRAVGETMAVAIAAGQSATLTANPFRSVETMTAYIVNVSLGDTAAGTIEYTSLYAVALMLFSITLLMNIVSQFILRRFREVYQ